MSILVNTNVGMLRGSQNIQQLSEQINNSVQKLSTGSRLTSSRDDAASVKLVSQFETQLTGLNQGTRNANDGISMAQIAEGALSEISTNLQRSRQLVITGGNRTLSSEGRSALGEEFKELLDTNNIIANNTFYGSIGLLNYEPGEAGFQIQARPEPNAPQTVTTGNAVLTSLFGKFLNNEGITGQTLSALSNNLGNTGELGKLVAAYMLATNESDAATAADALFTGTRTGNISELVNNSSVELDITELNKVLINGTSAQTGQSAIITGIAATFTAFADTDVNSGTGFSDAQLNQIHAFSTDTLLDVMAGLSESVSRQRAKLGSDQNGLMSIVRANSSEIINVKDARSRIADTDFASESAKLTRNKILLHAANTIMAQANQKPQIALSLLR